MKIMPFLLGGIGYPCLEILYRGRTHPAMALAGALAFPAIKQCAQARQSLPLRALRAACAVTAIEYAVGITWNRRHRIWDYRALPGHVRGQICPQFFCLWYLMAFGIILCFDGGKKREAGQNPRKIKKLPGGRKTA